MADYAIHEETLTDIADTIRKKDGTQALIDPADYADRINLMGMLPEKTASGAIAHITDGADRVPVKAWGVTIAPNLSGVSSVGVVQTGKNLFDYEAVEAFNANVIITRNDGDYTMQNNNSYAVGAFRGILFHLKPATYSLSLGESISVPIRIYKNGSWFNNGINAGETSCTFTVTEEADYDLSCNVSANSSLTIKKCQFEVGSSSTTYAPYIAPTQYTASLGRTIYGGSVDVVNGTGTDNCKKIALGDYTWIKSGTEGNFYCQQITDLWYPSEGGISRYGIGDSDEFEFVQATPTDGQINAYFNTAYSGYRIFIKKTDYAESTSAEFKEYLQSINAHLVYKVNDATTEDFTFTPITPTPETKLGDNNFWANEGDSAIQYRADIDLVLQSLQGSRGLMMATPPQTEENEEQEEER